MESYSGKAKARIRCGWDSQVGAPPTRKQHGGPPGLQLINTHLINTFHYNRAYTSSGIANSAKPHTFVLASPIRYNRCDANVLVLQELCYMLLKGIYGSKWILVPLIGNRGSRIANRDMFIIAECSQMLYKGYY